MTILATFFLLISGGALLTTVIQLIVIAVIFWVLHWAIGALNVPEPFNKVIRVILILAAVLIIVHLLLALVGRPIFA